MKILLPVHDENDKSKYQGQIQQIKVVDDDHDNRYRRWKS